jgi:hypothetical protein
MYLWIYTPRKESQVPTGWYEARCDPEMVWMLWREEKSRPYRDPKSDLSQLSSHYIDWTIPTPSYFWYILTYLQSWALPEKLPIVQPFRKFPAILRNPKVHHRVHRSPPLVPILSQFDPVPPIQPYISKIHFNIVHPPALLSIYKKRNWRSQPAQGVYGFTLLCTKRFIYKSQIITVHHQFMFLHLRGQVQYYLSIKTTST